MTLTLDQLDVDGQGIRSVWTGTSPTFPQPMRGQGLLTISKRKTSGARRAFSNSSGEPTRIRLRLSVERKPVFTVAPWIESRLLAAGAGMLAAWPTMRRWRTAFARC